MKIRSKEQMYDLQMRHRLGNCLDVWIKPKEVRRSDYDGPIAIRSLVPGHRMQTHIGQCDLEIASEEYLEREGLGSGQIIYSEMVAPSMGIRRLLNAELMRTEGGIYVRWCDKNIHMPEAMKVASVSERSVANVVLSYFLDPSDLDDVNVLLDDYPESVFEISVLDRGVGWADRRMVVWEVRNY